MGIHTVGSLSFISSSKRFQFLERLFSSLIQILLALGFHFVRYSSAHLSEVIMFSFALLDEVR